MIKETIHAFLWTYRHINGKLKVPEIEFVKKYLRPDSICFDVGAHSGQWAVGLAKALPDAHVYAFEALPYYADVLKMTIQLLHQKQVTVINSAIQETDIDSQIVSSDLEGRKLTGKTHVATNGEKSQKTVTVKGLALDSFWRIIGRKQIDFIKCDVEGYEYFVLKGAKCLVKECRPIFFNELDKEWCERYGYAPGDIFSFFEEIDYVPYYIDLDNGLIPVNVSLHVSRDVLFLPREKLK